MKYFFKCINVFSKSSYSTQKISWAGLHAEKRAKFPYNSGASGHAEKTICRHEKKHKACSKKYKPCILKYKALILKYMPYIFRLFKQLKNSNIQKPFQTP